MTALFAISTFFFIFVVVYLAITTVLAATSWCLKRRADGKGTEEGTEEIERRMDRVKDKAFLIALVLTFFVVTPFVIVLWVMP